MRERLSFLPSRINFISERLREIAGVSGVVILSTCNRTEIYCDASFDVTKNLLAFWANTQEISLEKIKEVVYVLRRKETIHHLFYVSTGLDSQVIGESEILGQIKQAYFGARENGFTTFLLNKIFEKAIFIGKRIRSETKISQGNISISSLAVRLLEKEAGNLENKRIVLLGAGEVIKKVAQNLRNRKIEAVVVSNRRHEKAIEISRYLGGRAVYLGDLFKELAWSDILISATSSPYPLVRKNDIQKIMQERNQRLFILDLALPRDVEEAVREIRGVKFYNLEDINLSLAENYQNRLEEAKRAGILIEENLERFIERESRFTLVSTEKSNF